MKRDLEKGVSPTNLSSNDRPANASASAKPTRTLIWDIGLRQSVAKNLGDGGANIIEDTSTAFQRPSNGLQSSPGILNIKSISLLKRDPRRSEK